MNTAKSVIALGILAFSSGANASTAKVAFVAETNVKMFRFAGQSTAVKANLKREGSTLKALEIRVPIAELTTGMDIRDKHMRERIFVAEDGSSPDIVFTASQADCRPAKGEEQACTVSGKLSFRGKTLDHTLAVTLKSEKTVTGTATIDVTQFGVKSEALAWTSIRVNPKTRVDFELDLP